MKLANLILASLSIILSSCGPSNLSKENSKKFSISQNVYFLEKSAASGNIKSYWDLFVLYETEGDFSSADNWLQKGISSGEPNCVSYFVGETLEIAKNERDAKKRIAGLQQAKTAFDRASANLHLLDLDGRTVWAEQGSELSELIEAARTEQK